MAIQSIYVEKKPPFAVEAKGVLGDLRGVMQIESITGVRILNRYLVEHLSPGDFAGARSTVFSEPPVDLTYDTLPDFGGARVFAVEFLPGQFDQRADSCMQCIQLATGGHRPLVHYAKIYVIEGEIDDETLVRIKDSLINPVESRETPLSLPKTLEADYPAPDSVEILRGFTALDEDGLRGFLASHSLAMDLDDLRFCQQYFAEQAHRDPSITEIRMIDTYWSDHCRHTTFLTHLESAEIEPAYIRAAWEGYQDLRQKLGRQDRPVTLMDMATIGARSLKAAGKIPDLDESEEINACSVKIKVDVDGQEQDWLLMFKNETHNHPTEIEPFGGAATCLGGAIRDPLSGRSYVYQAMRLTGAANPLAPVDETLPGKLPQRKIVTTAAAGYASYGNQIGLATGHVHEIYHPGYLAKRMEVGAVLGAAPAKHVIRERPEPGDVVILAGGRTGRDGCGGATGSSKSHTAQSLESCGAEVQKGNPPVERSLQRLFRNPEATRLIRRCNDFGAGGVAVAIGELADGLRIDLDAVPKKYDGLDGTELAISESQERMAVVVRAEDAARFIELAGRENLEAVKVAEVTAEPRLVMTWRGDVIVDIARSFLDSNGVAKTAAIRIPGGLPAPKDYPALNGREITEMMASLSFCCQKGLVDRFDSTVGAGSVLLPFGGRRQLSPTQAMAAKIPVLGGETSTCSLMAWGFDPLLSSASPFHGGAMAVVHSIAKIIAAGGSRGRCWLSFQEYFERLGDDPLRWGKPAAALLGALEAQMGLACGSIGGKDSMSGSFEEIDVPPTLISFAVSVAKTGGVLSPEFKAAASRVYLLQPNYTAEGLPDYAALARHFDAVEALLASGKVRSAWAVGEGGSAEAVANMCFGNALGFAAAGPLTAEPLYGAFLLEADELPEYADHLLGETLEDYVLQLFGGETVDLAALQRGWEGTLAPVFPWDLPQQGPLPDLSASGAPAHRRRTTGPKTGRPRVVIPTFPGTNCEEDTARAFRLAGAETEIVVIRNRSAEDIASSVETLAGAIRGAQMIALPGGFSCGDEPEGSAKFIVSFFRNARVREAVEELLANRDGLICGICNGFQALIKLGLLPYGEYREMQDDAPTLTGNTVGRHQSMLVRTRVVSNRSPWLCGFREGETFTIPISHGEGRLIASPAQAQQLLKNGQIATVYVDESGQPTQNIRHNPNDSVYAIEGLLSPDGRIFGRMGHCERAGENLYRNVPGDLIMDIFGSAVAYYE